jgi:phosphoenolpyruvate-protein phosphotransferase
MPDLVGIVVVSHSRPLARAAVELALEMAQGQPVRIAVAAGVADIGGAVGFGTDGVAIADAIGQVAGPAGVVVLMDLGSALLSAELAFELLDDDLRERVLLSPAPLVEGLVGAVVAAAGGGSRAEVAAEAAAGLSGKQSQLEPPPGSVSEPEVTTVRGTFVVKDPQGLHARPAAALVAAVRTLGAPAWLRNRTTGAGPVSGGSLSRVATLGALAGHEIEISVKGGPELQPALDELLATMGSSGTGSSAGSPAGLQPAGLPPAGGGALAASPGVAIGPVLGTFPASAVEVPSSESTAGAAIERERLDTAVATVRADVRAVRDRVAVELGAAEAGIFEAHMLLLEDPELLATAEARLAEGATAAEAWSAALGRAEAEWAALADPYLRSRAADLAALRTQVLDALARPAGSGHSLVASGTEAAGVLVGADLTPAEAARLDPSVVSGVVLAYGSPTAHSVILLRARGIPGVVAAGSGVLGLAPGTVLALDGGTGELVVAPESQTLAEFAARREAADRGAARARTNAGRPARTSDGVQILVGANLGGVADAQAAAVAGADLAGLVRTEFLFLGRSSPPDEDEQVAAYRALAEALGGRRLTLRTLDVGGDKPLAYLPVPASANPFLGVRGLRLSLLRPALFATQLAAIVRIAHETPVTAMFPMVSTVDELRSARSALEVAVRAVGKGVPKGLRVSAMIEVPAAALKAAALAPLVDEFSIGTNDLTQYALAAARGDGTVAALGDPWDPGVLRLVEAVCRGAGRVPVAVCGEFAADPDAAGLLVGLGVRELSVTPAAVPAVKEAVRAVDVGTAAKLAARALAEPGPAEVRALYLPVLE